MDAALYLLLHGPGLPKVTYVKVTSVPGPGAVIHDSPYRHHEAKERNKGHGAAAPVRVEGTESQQGSSKSRSDSSDLKDPRVPGYQEEYPIIKLVLTKNNKLHTRCFERV
jgi:hypothetical protein